MNNSYLIKIAAAVTDPITPYKVQDPADIMGKVKPLLLLLLINSLVPAFVSRDRIPRTPTEDPEVKIRIATPTSLETTPTTGFDLLNEDIQPPSPYHQISNTSSDISDSSSDDTPSFHDVPVGNLLNLST